MSTAASIKPPIIEAFLKNWMRWAFFLAGSFSSQNRCPAAVVGTSVAASTVLESRGIRPGGEGEPGDDLHGTVDPDQRGRVVRELGDELLQQGHQPVGDRLGGVGLGGRRT